jgi:hypothetical protein
VNILLQSLLVLTVASLALGCAADDPHSMPYKKFQSFPYEISGPPNSHGLSKDDIRQIELLVSRHKNIRKPILRMWAGRNDRVQVSTGHDARPGDLYNWFDVEKRHGEWVIVPPIYDSRDGDERSGIMRIR